MPYFPLFFLHSLLVYFSSVFTEGEGEGFLSQLFHVDFTKTVELRLGIDVGGDLLHRLGKGGVNTHFLLHLI